MKISAILSALALVGALQLTAAAQFPTASFFVDPALPGTTQYDLWDNFGFGVNQGYPGFPGSGTWPAPIGSNGAGSGDATVLKLANGAGGGPYPASASLYYGGFSSGLNINGGRLGAQDATPVANLKNVVFQLDIGESSGYDFFNDAQPTLNYNGGSQSLAAAGSFLLNAFDNGTVSTPDGVVPVFINTYLFQWDLSSVVDSISSFSIEFNGVQHGQVYGMQLDQSDTFAAYGVPEPASLAMAALSGVAMLAVRRRRAS